MTHTCPYNAFCVGRASKTCNTTIMSECSDCNYAGYVATMSIASILGVVIVFGNLLTICVFLQRWKNGRDMKMDAIKLSLAVSDLLTGVQVLTSYVPNLSRAFHSTVFEDRTNRLSTSNFCGVLNTLAFVSSLYHLLLLGLQRIYAVTCTLRFRKATMKPVRVAIIIVWLIATMISIMPSVIPDLRYEEIHYVCFISADDVTISFIIVMSFALVLPFISMIIVSTATAILARRKMNSTNLTGMRRWSTSEKRNTRSQQQINLFKTIAIMQLGFILTVGPGVGGLLVYLVGALPCQLFETFLMACFVIYFLNSLVNVVVYSFREKKFRLSVKQILTKMKIFNCILSQKLSREPSFRQPGSAGTAMTTM